MNSKEFIQSILTKYNLNQNQLSKLTGISPPLINRWFRKNITLRKGSVLIIETALKKYKPTSQVK